MPIHRKLELTDVSDTDFDLIDDAVMGAAYAAQNKFGNRFDERVYENEMAAKLRADGFDVHTQVPVTVTHGGFEKTYFLDLVVNHMLYELKVVAALQDEHKAQALHYAMLQDIRRVKLINFGEPRVCGRLVRNVVPEAERRQPMLRNSGWHPLTPQCEVLVGHLRAILRDWGTHLSTQLYNEALVHFFGGEGHCLQRIEVRADNLHLGTHLVQMHAANHGFTVTALTRNETPYREHLEALLAHTSLEAVQWINLNHSRVEITTVGGDGRGMGAKE